MPLQLCLHCRQPASSTRTYQIESNNRFLEQHSAVVITRPCGRSDGALASLCMGCLKRVQQLRGRLHQQRQWVEEQSVRAAAIKQKGWCVCAQHGIMNGSSRAARKARFESARIVVRQTHGARGVSMSAQSTQRVAANASRTARWRSRPQYLHNTRCRSNQMNMKRRCSAPSQQ